MKSIFNDIQLGRYNPVYWTLGIAVKVFEKLIKCTFKDEQN
ncbi:hypothetical protein [Sphingobacterium detergens]|uniref:Uncharacterized protein n=1 Tax=Sphingobacterium detergens TaxID=1145106 RepID=A0A420ALM8_SPHD1|nr:hypothetical protein [Sphingobacterium detergens]RKE45361.1 hypothetical protein DFQ12_4433 [Sphingobacterium detergens]